MAGWPTNPVAIMKVDNFKGGTSSNITYHPGPNQATFDDVTIDFTVKIEYHDHPWFDYGKGYFRVQLYVYTTMGWTLVQKAEKTLGDLSEGDWSDWLKVTRTMQDWGEQYQLSFHCETQQTSLGSSEDGVGNYQANTKGTFLANFTLDFVPITIAYCPPGQDMTNSLTQSTAFGTKLTIGTGQSMESNTKATASISALGLFTEGIGFSDSQSVSNKNTSGILISHFRNTVVTADNQKAIGRAYWGPLGDLFVVAVSPAYSANQVPSGSILYSPMSIEQVIMVPAWKLLRPGADPIASSIPAAVRRRLLSLDPFITNLDKFFPDSGADLAIAANPFADPSANNRAELIGRWWLDTGAELNYTLGQEHRLFSTQTNEVEYKSTVKIYAQAGIPIQGLILGLGLDAANTTTVALQSSQEADTQIAKTAACSLIHNQNDRNLDGIQLYFDKIFSTFMFQRVSGRPQPPPPSPPPGITTTVTAGTITSPGITTTVTAGTITRTVTTGTSPPPSGGAPPPPPPGPAGRGALGGWITNWEGVSLRGLQVYLMGSDGSEQQTSTDVTGHYSFMNLGIGDYTLVAGDQRTKVTIGADCSYLGPERVNLTNVRRVLDLRTAPVWEVADALGLSTESVRKIGRELAQISHEEHVAKAVGADPATVERWRHAAVFTWPGFPGGPSRKAQPHPTRPAGPSKPPKGGSPKKFGRRQAGRRD